MLTQLDKRSVSATMVLLAACLSVGPAIIRVCAAEAVSIPRYGAADFMPTPEQAIGFQADGNGWYPGATPAVVEWWDGTPGWGKVIHRGGTGNASPPGKRSRLLSTLCRPAAGAFRQARRNQEGRQGGAHR
jgi:hypothetical protein